MSQALNENTATLLSAPGTMLRAITPSDGAALPLGTCRALIVGTAGNLAVIAEDDSVAVTVPVQAGVFPVRCKAVQSTGTTATGIVAIY